MRQKKIIGSICIYIYVCVSYPVKVGKGLCALWGLSLMKQSVSWGVGAVLSVTLSLQLLSLQTGHPVNVVTSIFRQGKRCKKAREASREITNVGRFLSSEDADELMQSFAFQTFSSSGRDE